MSLVLCLLVTCCRAQASDTMRINRLGIEKGLSNNSVRCIYQDHNGFMWFGSYDGLNRYDGYEFKIFRNSLADSNSLPHNFIYAIHEDAEHNLWIGTGQGIGIYSDVTGDFRPAYQLRANGRLDRITNNVNSLAADHDGDMYIGTNGAGLMVQHKGAAGATQILVEKDGKNVTNLNVTSIRVDSRNKVWMFISPLGLCYYDKATQKIIVVNNTLDRASTIEIDPKGAVLIGSPYGIYKFISTNLPLQLVYSEEGGMLQANNVVSLCRGADGKLWAGSRGGGVSIIDETKQTVQQLQPGETAFTLSSESVSAIYEDREGRKWMGTLKGGVNVYSPARRMFQTITHEPNSSNSLINNFAAAFWEDRDKRLWIGTDGGGFSIWNRATNQFTNYRHEPGRPQSLSNNHVSCIIQDRFGDTWISTFGGGINRFDPASNSFRHYTCENPAAGLENQEVWIMYEDRQGMLWATTFGNGSLYYFDRTLDRFLVFSQQIKDVLTMFEDSRGALWCGTPQDLIRIDRNDKQHVRYPIRKPVRAIHEDKLGNFWIGSEGGGLLSFDRLTGNTGKRYTMEDGLANNAVLNILEDKYGNLWMSTFNGLSQLNSKDNSFKNYYQDDGLQSNQFLYSAALKLRSGEMIFGGIHGFNIFHPDNIVSTRTPAPVHLTGLRINNLPLPQAAKYITAASGGQVLSIEIPYDDAVLSVDFAALEYSAPNKISYAYYLDGWDKDWNYSGKVRTATYTKLHEGSYRLRIKATDAAGAWTGKEWVMQVTVLPPWYRSWWAYVLYLSAIISAIVLYQRYRANRARLQYEVAIANANASREKAERERAEAELQSQAAQRETEKVKAEKEQEINDKRLAFFTNISHEFRTPISLIINPVKDLLAKPEGKKNDLAGLQLVYRNARRLLSLVDQLLLFRKAEAGADRLRIVPLDLCALCKEVFYAFEQQARSANMDYTFQSSAETIEVYADREKLEIAFYNLLSNAFKYTPAGGAISLEVKDGPGTASVSIRDTGYGIPAQVGDKLFDRFFQVQKKNGPTKPGFGIGLYLVRHFVESLKGNIRYESEEGTGSCFYVELLKGRGHFDDELIVEHQPAEPTLLKELVDEQPAGYDKLPDHLNMLDPDTMFNEKRSMLVVDDDEQIRQYLARLFDAGFTVYTADNAVEGFKLASQHVPDIVISDVNMEGMDGIELCTAIKEDPSLSHIPVILLTGNEAQETKLEGLEGGADDYIMKPFDNELLMARVQNILKSRTTLQKFFYNEITLGKTAYKVTAEYQEFLKNCIAIVEAHLDNPDFGIKMLATELRMGQSNLYKKVKSISGQSPVAFIRFIRLRKVAKTLMETNYNINEAAFDAGFNDMKHFREHFTKLFGMKPSDFVKTYRKGGGEA